MATPAEPASEFRDVDDVVSQLSSLRKKKELSDKEHDAIKAAVRDADEAIDRLESELTSVAAAATAGTLGADAVGSAQGSLLAAIASSTLSLNQIQGIFGGLKARAKQLVHRILRWLLARLLRLLAKFRAHLKVSGWSLTVSGGFPSGITVQVTVNFT